MQRSQLISRIYILLIAILTAIGLWVFPVVGDDLNSIHCVRDAFLNTDSTLFYSADFSQVSLAEVWNNIKMIFAYDHFRLPNLLMPLVILLPRWIPAAISGGALYYIISRGAEMCDRRRLHFSPAVWIVFVMIVIFPWNDQLYLTSFQAPYLWDAALALWLWRRLSLIRPQAPTVVMLIAGFLTAFGQEAYGVALTGATIICTAYNRRMLCKGNIAASVGMVLGLIAVLIPSFICQHWLKWTFFSNRSIVWLPYAAFCLAYPSALLIRRKQCSLLELYSAIVAVISVLLTAYFRTGARVCSLGVISAGIGFGILMFHTSPKKIFKYITCIAAILLPAHLIAVDIACLRAGKATREAIEQYKATPDALIFTNLDLRQNAPWYLLQKPYYDWMYHDCPVKLFAAIYGAPHHKPLRILPDCLRDFRPEKGTPIPGTAELISYKGLMVGHSPGTINLQVDFGRGPTPTRMHIIDFIPDHGDSSATYRWYYPDHTIPAQLLSPVPCCADTYFHYVP